MAWRGRSRTLTALALSMCAISGAQSNTTALVERYQSEPVSWKQFEIAKELVALHDPSVLPALTPLLAHPDRHIRGNAAFVFASLGDQTGFDVIVAILNDKSPDRTLWPPSAFVGPIAQRPAHRTLKQQIAEDRYYAVILLRELKDPGAIPVLTPLLSDPELNSTVRVALEWIRATAR